MGKDYFDSMKKFYGLDLFFLVIWATIKKPQI